MKVKILSKNHALIFDGSRVLMQSYNSIIAVLENGHITLDSYYWDYSTTTDLWKYTKRRYDTTMLSSAKTEK